MLINFLIISPEVSNVKIKADKESHGKKSSLLSCDSQLWEDYSISVVKSIWGINWEFS